MIEKPPERPRCRKCGQCCLMAPCHLAEDFGEPNVDGPCRLLLPPNGDGERLCSVYDEIMRIPSVSDPGNVFAPGCCMSGLPDPPPKEKPAPFLVRAWNPEKQRWEEADGLMLVLVNPFAEGYPALGDGPAVLAATNKHGDELEVHFMWQAGTCPQERGHS